MEKFDWIKKHYECINKDRNYGSVSRIIPNEFDDYFLIHWNVGIIENFPFEEYPEINNAKKESIEELNDRIKVLKRFGIFLNSKEDGLFEKTTLKKIAKKFKVEYNYNVLDNIKNTPGIKFLNNLSIKNLKHLVSLLSEKQKLNLFIEDIYRFTHNNEQNQEIESISVIDYFKWQKKLLFDSNSYLFPDNRQWCITTTEDWYMLLCTEREVTNRIKKEIFLEFFEIDYNRKY